MQICIIIYLLCIYAILIFSHHSPFGPNNPLSMFMPSLQNLQSLQQSDVLEKLKMQVGLMDTDFSLHALAQQNSAFSSQNGFPFMTPSVPNTKEGKFNFICPPPRANRLKCYLFICFIFIFKFISCECRIEFVHIERNIKFVAAK